MTILLTKAVRAGGVILASGSTQTLDAAVEGQLVHNGSATYVSDPSTALNYVPVTASKTLPGVIEFSNSDLNFVHASERSILTIGGDHPYAQWWGSNGSDGMMGMYADLKIRPYIAICEDQSSDATSGSGATLGKAGMLTVNQALALQKRGAEFINHGARHTHFWELFNTGIRVYYTGAEATPTVNISTTQLTTSTATTGATAFVFTTYPTIAALQTAINALAGWNCILATELTGQEPSAALMPLNAARSVVDLGGADPTDSNQRFALSGGIMLRYTGTAYKNIAISVNDGSNFFSVFADGARLLAQTTATTLTAIVTAINGLNIAGLTALVMDNGYNATTVGGSTALNPGQKQRETYCFGDESGLGLIRIGQLRCVTGVGVNVSGGLGLAYTLLRSVLAVKERAEAQGLQIDAFAQSGGRFWPQHIHAIGDEQGSWRGNRSYTENFSGLSPHAMPQNGQSKFTGHFTSIISSSSGVPYSESDVKAIIDALGDTCGWYVNWLNHLCTPTPGDPSPYTGMNQQSVGTYASGADQDEGPFYRELVHAADARDAGKIDILPPSLSERVRVQRRGPSNLVFNPKFRNGRSDNLLNINSIAAGAGGVACPGWNLATPSSDFSSALVSDGELKLTTNGALGANKAPIGCNIFLEPGKTYSIGAVLDLSGLATNALVRFGLHGLNNRLGDSFDPALQISFVSQPFYGGYRDSANMMFTVPHRTKPDPAYVRSIAGAFAFTSGDAITLTLDAKGASAPIVLTGLTTAKAVAAAINAALASDAIYGTLAQYHDVARAENNRLVIECPWVAGAINDGGTLMTLTNSVGTPLATLFGAGVSTVRAASQGHQTLDASMVGYRLAVLPSSTAATAVIKISKPFCREVQL